MVIHGGEDGQLKDYGYPDDFVFEWTKAKLQTLDAGEGETLPTLEEVFELFRGNMFINIELKGPRSEEYKHKYSCKKAAEEVYDLVIKHNMHGKFLISSFGSDILE
jgi:glycerophosphoryl diester phosphodiesterase